MGVEQAVRRLRADPRYAELIRDSYLEPDVFRSSKRFLASAEFAEARRLLGNLIPEGKILDCGAGTGIASYAFARCGAQIVYALEPDPSNEVGQGAIRRLARGMPIRVIDTYAEEIPLPDAEVDIVYTRQVLHHVSDLRLVLGECARVLRSGGMLLACREHVVDDDQQLQTFLRSHPVHQLVGGENAYPLSDYTEAVLSAGLELKQVLGPWDTIINAFPVVRTAEELERYPRTVLERRFGRVGALASMAPGIETLMWRRLKRPTPGRLYSFLAMKP